ncbi:sensor domain-containing diguanylate cyclase [Solibacillus sp. FSL K6-1523]|uniref:sensor domain-containing diguanylate cyclase n=1 Tax=Solibacillus sp. FSL K6-1523 TaxID=2921471 RepID=UPI0030F9D586
MILSEIVFDSVNVKEKGDLMVVHQKMIEKFKSDVLSLCINSKEDLNNFEDYFSLLNKCLTKFFGVEECFLFIIEGETLKPLHKEIIEQTIKLPLAFNLFEASFNDSKVVELPAFFKEKSPFIDYTSMMLVKLEEAQPEAILLFKCNHEHPECLCFNHTNETVTELASVFKYLYQTFAMQVNEQQYRKLYNMTDLFHSTMDIDIILENVLVTIEENFQDLEVELILSNDQDRQTRVRIKPFDYLSERASTVEAFVSGELKEEVAEDLNCHLLNAPIKGRQAIYGILQVKAPLTYAFSDAQKEFICMLAQASGNSLENAKLYHQSHRLISDLQLINETSHRLNMKLNINEMLTFLQKQLIKSFQPMEIGFLLKENESFEISNSCTALFQSIDGSKYIQHVEKHFENTQDPLFIADFSRLLEVDIEYKSLMAIPMIVEEKINGFSIVLHKEPYFFSFDSFKLMQSLIHHSSLAISNSILRDQLQEMVDRDHLTKLFTRNYSDKYIINSLEQDDSGMFLLVDIDNFKKVNDTHGHQVGDDVLVQISSEILNFVGTRGICSRWGGEELSIYIPNILENEALKISKKIVEVVPKVTSPAVTISAGMMAWKKENRPHFQQFFRQADVALYCAKNSGKNNVRVFEDSMQLQS